MKIDYEKYSTAPAIPEAPSMIETFRAIGYSIESAIADVIDNSISASAKNVWVNFEWLGGETWIAIRDDGFGMNNEELIQAMRPGSKSPLDARDSKDLGRFGLGLKTASFSQCRRLSVLSKKTNSAPVFWTWDLDFVNHERKWHLLKYLPDEKENIKKIQEQKSGTLVIWGELDRLVKNFSADDNKALERFLVIMEQVKKNLGMVFHRFIEQGKINIHFQDRPVKAWNPFLKSEAVTQGFPEEPMQNAQIIVKGFVLPHKAKLDEDAFNEGGGLKGWNEQQGFYIYRNERLLVAGDWLGLFRKEEHYKLARIQVDLPNTFDGDWQIDIKKSVARPPSGLREQLRAYANQVRAQAIEVYRHRGRTVKQVPTQKFVPLWLEHKRGNKWYYKINQSHPLIEKIKTQASKEPDKAIETLIRFIEETVPTKSIYIKESAESETLGNPFEGLDQEPVRKIMKEIYQNLLREGKTDERARAIILNMEPFNNFPHLFEFIN